MPATAGREWKDSNRNTSLTIKPQSLCSPVLSQIHTLPPKKEEENQRKSPTYYFVLWLVKMFLISFFFSWRNNFHTMKCTNIKCRALNLYTPIHPCNLSPSQDIRHKGRTYKEKKRLVINRFSENTDRCLSHCHGQSFWSAETFTHTVTDRHETKFIESQTLQNQLSF